LDDTKQLKNRTAGFILTIRACKFRLLFFYKSRT
jgi:hypothetical protein